MPTADHETQEPPGSTLSLQLVCSTEDLPPHVDRPTLVRFFHETMKPYEDEVPDIERALDYAFSPAEGKGGYLVLASAGETLAGAVLMLHTGMAGYVPETILLFVAVDPARRNQGIGGRIIREAVKHAPGAVKLHVEYDNPAKRLYERLGFASKYAEMRLPQGALQ